jgi:hypothetical protein
MDLLLNRENADGRDAGGVDAAGRQRGHRGVARLENDLDRGQGVDGVCAVAWVCKWGQASGLERGDDSKALGGGELHQAPSDYARAIDTPQTVGFALPRAGGLKTSVREV